jgi:hypothetical protein
VHGLENVDHPAVVGQDQLPRQRAQQEAGEEGCDHEDQHQVLPAPSFERDRVRQHVTDQQADEGGDSGVPQ